MVLLTPPYVDCARKPTRDDDVEQVKVIGKNMAFLSLIGIKRWLYIPKQMDFYKMMICIFRKQVMSY